MFTWLQRIAFLVLFGGLAWALVRHTGLTLSLLYLATFIGFAAAIVWRLFAASASLAPLERSPASAPVGELPIYTILCPLYREAAVVPALAEALAALDYPRDRLDIKYVIEADDAETLSALEALAPRYSPFDIVRVEAIGPRTKPKALNVALVVARGEFLTVYDAEDRPHPKQLKAALARFAAGDARLACLQAPLLIDNAHASWLAEQFATEYAVQFGEVLPLLARLGLPLPLGGTSNHFRVAALRDVHGWDSYNVSEDRSNFANELNRFRTSAFHIPFVSQSCASAA